MIDLHLHSRASDGSLKPAQLVQLCAERGVQMLALTDHDCLRGLEEARLASRAADIRFIPGVEISVTWEHKTLHVVGLNIDADSPVLKTGLARMQQERIERAREIGRRLEIRGYPGACAGALALAEQGNVTRTHFARWLQANGHAGSMQKAFQRLLAYGKPGYVASNWAGLEECIRWIHAAGGMAVLAHPLRYRMTRTWLMRALDEFKQAGGDGIEVICGGGNRDEHAAASHYAKRFQLSASVGSDFHSPAAGWNQPGIDSCLLQNLAPVWECF